MMAPRETLNIEFASKAQGENHISEDEKNIFPLAPSYSVKLA
jgi:hypothetical protein